MRAVLCALLAALAARAAAFLNIHSLQEMYLHMKHYKVEGHQIKLFHTGYTLKVFCHDANVFDSPALPRAAVAIRVSTVTLVGCAPPTAGSLADTLTALNVVLECSELDPGKLCSVLKFWNLPVAPPLTAKHFKGLENLTSLEVKGKEFPKPQPEYDFLAPLQNLRSVEIKYVVLAPGELHVKPTLELLRITAWTESLPAPLAHCNALRELHLKDPALIALPDGWVANCSRLEVLVIALAFHLTTLPPKFLVGTSALRQFTVQQGALEILPVGLLDYSPNLSLVNWGFNRLRTLPRGIFDEVRRVQELDLSLNHLDSGVMAALAHLEELTELNLERNHRLGDICGMDGYSSIRNLTKLKKLLLGGTGVTRICRDWREDMIYLETLDLSRTEVTKLSFQDLQFTRAVEATMALLSPAAPVTVVGMTRDDYNSGARGLSSGVIVQLDYLAPVECDCNMYWTRRVLDLYAQQVTDESKCRARSGPASRLIGNLLCTPVDSECRPTPGPSSLLVGSLYCTDGRRLRDVPPEDMVCTQLEECEVAKLPRTCTCDERPDDNSGRDSRLVRVRCEHAGLQRVPHLRSRDNSTERLYELFLASNNISELHADDLKNHIKALDLSNNSLRAVDDETAKKLRGINGMLRLAGNKFDCSCGTASLLLALHARNRTQTDLINSTCSDGRSLDVNPVEYCLPSSLSTWLAIALGVLLVIVVSIVLSLASRERRFFMLAVLHRWGIVWRAAEPAQDEARHYDAFVTFSHKDEALVPELMARLEPTYRLCVHYRDWTPGRFISEQVVESVRDSRRTIALVSRHFLASSWARAEFREAHAAAMLDARPRLIVVLLEEPAALEMDDLLHRYVTTHTYLSWGEPWFWDKLSVALPRPRALRVPPAHRPHSRGRDDTSV